MYELVSLEIEIQASHLTQIFPSHHLLVLRLLIAKNFDYPEEVKESFKIMRLG